MVVVEVGGAGQACGEGGLAAGVALNEAAHIVTEAPVPLAPHVPVGEAAHLQLKCKRHAWALAWSGTI